MSGSVERGTPIGATRRPTAADEAIAFVREALADPPTGDRIRVVTIPAPPSDPRRLVASGQEPGVYWATPDGTAWAGIGTAHTITASGAGRFAEVRRRAAGLWPRLERRTHESVPDPEPRLFGGFAFLPGPHPAPWQAFGDATFMLPRVVRVDDERGSRLSIAVAAADGPEGADRAVQRVRRFLGEARTTATGTPTPGETGLEGAAPDARDWTDAVRSIQELIRDGRVEKVVAARSETVERRGPLSPAHLVQLLRRLEAEAATAVFAFRLGDSTFIGATPERLVRRSGSEVRTEALAGTVAAGEDARLQPLLESVKEGAEHAVVVRAIAEALGPFCDSLDYPRTPEVQRLRHVHHLQTPFRGRLTRSVHVLELAARLHPTPAVGGWPTDEAVRWIREREAVGRGWYAAPVGWFDAEGDGELVVALRSGLLHRGRAILYAGAGIVAGSDAEAELAETEVKLRTMKGALGVR